MRLLCHMAGITLLILLWLSAPAHAEPKVSEHLPSPGTEKPQADEVEPPRRVGKPEVIGPGYFGKQFEERLLNLGTEEQFETLERNLIKDQVKTFIPPLLVPTVGGHAFVLPPGLFQVATNVEFLNLGGDDIFKDGKPNPIDIDKGVRRQFYTASIRYGFDLNRKFLHSFTAIVNIPYQSSVSTGDVILPSGGGGAGVDPGRYLVKNSGHASGLGDISLFIKKKVWDQANFPVGLAFAAGIYFPTGSDQEKAGDNGRISVDRPDGSTVNTMFRRFSDDGRFPAGLQPGRGTVSYQLAGFVTRQFLPGDMPKFLAGTPLDRGVIHFGGFHRFNREHDGIDAGDLSVAFFTGLVPVYKDYVSLQFTNINLIQQADSYQGTFRFPGTTNAVPRPPFRKGWTSLVGPGLIFSPDPIIRITATALFRVKAPTLGPAPPFVVNIGTSFAF